MSGIVKSWLTGLILAVSMSWAGTGFAEQAVPGSRVLSNGSQAPAALADANKAVKPTAPGQVPDAKIADKKPAVGDEEAVTPPEPPKAKVDEKTPAPADTTKQPDAAAPPAAAAAAAGEITAGESSPASSFLTPSVPSFGADGALRYGYDIDMPAFRGLEPSISLNYDSGRKTKTGGT